jgi:tetratricopeptide (TPR) repeat protein
MTTSTAPQPAMRYRPGGRAAGRPRQLWQVPTFLAGLLAVGLVAVNAVLHRPPGSTAQRELAAARAALRDPRRGPKQAAALAEKALAFAGKSVALKAEAHFLWGLAIAQLADAGPAEQARQRRQAALDQLRRAESLGVAESDRPRLWFTLGQLIWLTKKNAKGALPYLTRGLPDGADNPAEGYGLVADLYLQLPTPDLEAALAANQKQLDLARDGKLLAVGHLARGKILLQLERYAEAAKVLERVGRAAPSEVQLQARYFEATAYEKLGQWAKAAPLLAQLLQAKDEVPGGRGHALYVLGLCYHRQEPPDDEQARVYWQQAAHEPGAEGQAAAIGLAELDLVGSAPNLMTVAEHLKRAVDKVARPEDYHNPLVDLDRLRDAFEAALRLALEDQSFELARQLAELYSHVAAPGAAEVHLADAAEGLARQLDEQAQHVGGSDAAAFRQQARAQWTAAAKAAERAAKVKVGEQPDLLWQAARCYQKAQDHERAAAVLEQLVKMTLPDERKAQVWFNLGQARSAQGDKDKARQAYINCAEFSSTRFAYLARYELARDAIHEGQLDQAEKLLTQNLESINPQVDAKAYQESLYLLADLLFRQHQYDEAWVRLQQAARDYPDNPKVLTIRDELGECYHQLAKRERQRYQELTEPGRGGLDRDVKLKYVEQARQDWLAKAIEVYQQIKDELTPRAEAGKLSPTEAALLRKAALTIADLHYESNHCTEALRLYLEVARAYPTQCESLYACQGINACITVMLSGAQDELRRRLPEIKSVVRGVRDNVAKGRIPDEEIAQIPVQQNGTRWTRATLQAALDNVLEYLDKEAPKQLKGP